MFACAACGTENRDEARFCDGCGSPLQATAEPRDQRKTVTVVFCDLVGSTALGESRDLEAVRALLERYFETMRGLVERHGGTVEKFIGDAVVAVFGVPVIHEDDALRAVRAAVEMQAAMPGLGLQARIGVNTGEVMASRKTLVTGDAVNVAARLEQAARPGEILLGAETQALVRDAVKVEALAPLELKGKREGVAAFRLLAVEPGGAGVVRRLGGPMVGREYELRLLEGAFEGALRRRGCSLFTVLGVAGVGKSRLVREFLSGADARVLEGHCLSYGEGITYFPLVEIVRQLGGAHEELLAGNGGAMEAIGALLGEGPTATTAEEIAWAIRKLLEAAAAERPLVVVFDDIHWAEPTLLELIEQTADLSREAPILLLCMARPELLDRRPGWSGGKLNATTVQLESLDEAETDELIGRLLGGEELEPTLGERIRAAAEGNPLFLEEMLAMMRESDEGEVVVPPTIRALLAARLDQLGPAERSVLERGSIEGQLFHSAAVEALGREAAPVEAELESLVRKELVRPDRPLLAVGDAFRFRHLLTRDAAYEALPKTDRAQLHERYADWLEHHDSDLAERDEILGYHLERAHRYHDELGTTDGQTGGLGERAAGHLVSAGRRAVARGDLAAAVNLLERSVVLGFEDLRERARVQVELGYALYETGRRAESRAMLEASIETATDLGERGLATRAFVELSQHRFSAGELDPAAVEPVARQAIESFRELGDESGLAVAERLLALSLGGQDRGSEGLVARERAVVHAEAAGDRAMRRRAVGMLGDALCNGATPVYEAIGRCEDLRQASRDDRVLEAVLTRFLSLLYAMAGRSEEALVCARESSDVLDGLNQRTQTLQWQGAAARARELVGDRAGAEQEWTARWLQLRDQAGDTPERYAINAASELANFYCDEGRWDEAADLVSYGGDVVNRAPGLFVFVPQARLAAHRGEHAEALALIKREVERAERTDRLNARALVQEALAEVLRAGGRTVEADAALAMALELYDQKGNVAAAARLRAGV